MTAVLLLWRTRMRSSWRASIVLAVLIGLGGGVTLAVAAGARRTASANDAILRAAGASDVSGSFQEQDPIEMLPLLERVPYVDGVSIMVGFAGRLEGDGVPESTLYFLGLRTDRPTVDRPVVTAGRLPIGPNEVLLNEGAVARTGLRLGDSATLALADPSSISELGDFVRTQVDIVGIGLLAEEVIEDELGGRPLVLLSRALTEAHDDRRIYSVVGLSLTRSNLAAVATGLADVRDRAGHGGMVIERVRDDDRARVQAALRPLLGAFAGFALLVGTATVVVAAPARGRLVRRRPVDDRVLSTIGSTRRQLVAVDLACASTVAVAGMALALGLAVLASPLFPVGPSGRVRDVVGGVAVDATALVGGAACLLGALLVLVGWTSWRRRSRTGPVTPGKAPGLLGSRPSCSVGVRLTTGGRVLRTTTVGLAAGIAAVLAALTFTGSLDRLERDTDLVGMSWDVVARENFTAIDEASVRATAAADPSVRRVTGVGYGYGELNGTSLPAAQIRAVVGDPWPPIADGRAPRTSLEILVGKATREALALSLGDEVQLTLQRSAELGPGPEPRPLAVTVVGSAVAPAVGQAGIGTPRLDQGFLMSAETVEAILGEGAVAPYVYLFDLSPGANPQDLIDRFPDGLPDASGLPTEWFTSAVPAEVRQAADARPAIWLGVAALAVTVVATIAHTLLGFVRNRRPDYAVLKALGFTRGQIRSTVLWQSAAILGPALVAAVPGGVAAGRWMWVAFADGLGVIVRPVIPVLLLVAALAVTALAVQGVTLLPAALARRTPPGQTLRVE